MQQQPQRRRPRARRTSPKVKAVPEAPSRAIAPRDPAANALKAYVATREVEVADYQPHKTAFLEQIQHVDAMTVVGSAPSRQSNQTLAELRKYDRDDLMVVAEVAYHYLLNGGTRLAMTLFEGLAAVDPREPYFALALGLAHDHIGEVMSAHRWYKKAADLDSTDGRPDINRAELYIEAKDLARARQYLARGANKARKKGDQRLARKAMALLRHLDRRS